VKVKVTVRGDSSRLTWALWDLEYAVHAVPGRYRADVRPIWPADHIQSKGCPCSPSVTWDSEAAPRPLVEHRTLS
jgi:hypothetical protein